MIIASDNYLFTCTSHKPTGKKVIMKPWIVVLYSWLIKLCSIEPIKDDHLFIIFFLLRLTRNIFKEVSKNMKTILEKCLPLDQNSSNLMLIVPTE